MRLLTDGTEKDPILRFCHTVISQHGKTWPPTEDTLAEGFANWLGLSSFMSRSAMQRLCRSKDVKLSFNPLPHDIRGFNCSFHNKREIIVTARETVAFADSHTLLHEFREMLEHTFVDLGYPTVTSTASLETHAEAFAVLCGMHAVTRDLPLFLEMAANVERKWPRYFTYALVIVFGLACLFGCAFTPQMEEMFLEAKRQRYVRT
ncbi:MAG: hypothetical protein LAO24_03625 [Acidobacteriia bacterium]|nr:hypothetical protein [Terriglobia bacterium]